ncbi:PDZ domain-containing protein 8 isoform X2 [Eupeodes corollae]|uniref:PDZ domain-containing protein 8 isoform X2 n=1 Tax=Eupeodes corollae TaxID=290404 RepID=UPI002492AFA5|nr:PDZ domain-containing protein 8 isoform X2 [Eupeodes corollae]
MDLTSLLLFGFISLVIGAVLMLIVQYYIYMRFCDLPEVSSEQKDFNEKYTLPEDIHENASKFDPESKSPLMALNLIMQFLFHELKHTSRVRKWFYRKLSLELDELVTKTTIGKLFDKLTLKDLDLGDQFPEIKILNVHGLEIHETEGRIENLDLQLHIKYSGNFRMAVDAVMVLGKKASLTLKVKRLSGMARLQFTRKPYTHWSLSFIGDPELDLGIESKFQGRHMQSNISSLILNQIRRAVRRKHTLPKYKLRYKPFFQETEEEVDVDIQPNGLLEVKISELSRLMIPDATITDVYCTLTMASLAWVEAKQKDDRNVIVSIDVEIHKAKNQQIGILFKQGEHNVEIEAVLPNTPAIKSQLRSGDTLISIEGTRVNSIQQVAKIVKSLSKSVFFLRIERLIPGIIRNDAILEDLDVYEDLGEPKPSSLPKIMPHAELLTPSPQVTPSPGNPLPRQVRSNSSSESSISSTPTNSPKKTKLIAKAIKKTLTRESSDTLVVSTDDAKNSGKIRVREDSISNSPPALIASPPPSARTEAMDVEHYQQHSTIDCSTDKLNHMDDICRFKLTANCKFLNLCVYGKCTGDSVLLGFLNIPVKSIIGECMETSLIETMKTFYLIPPVKQDLKTHELSSMSGFNPNLCFGDILMAFSWDGNPIQGEIMKKPLKAKSSSEKSEEIEKSEATAATTSAAAATSSKTHNFVRTHFHRATQCDFCGKKIWLKDAVQCRDCSMTCHKKCITKCQNSTVCGPVDCSGVLNNITTPTTTTIVHQQQPEFTVTEAPSSSGQISIDEPFDEDQRLSTASPDSKITTTATEPVHRQSLTGLIAQGLKRVNSANNLVIPGISSSLNQNSKSLPPSPQHSPRKQSLVCQGVSPFIIVTQILESIPNDLDKLSIDQINSITEPIINIGRDEDVMTLAKDASKELFGDLSSEERMAKINELLTKLRLALDSETSNHSKLLEINPNESSIIKSASHDTHTRTQSNEKVHETDASISPNSKEAQARKAFDLGRSEERVQALSVIMLYLCTGLQHAQGVAFQ